MIDPIGKPRRKPGRPSVMDGGRSRRIYIDEESWEIAQKLGKGSGSEGIRRAIKIASDAA